MENAGYSPLDHPAAVLSVTPQECQVLTEFHFDSHDSLPLLSSRYQLPRPTYLSL